MNSTAIHNTVTLRSRLLRYLALPAAVIGLAIPAADARPGRDGGYRGGSSSYHHGGHQYHGHYSHHGHRYRAPVRHGYHAPPRYAPPVRYAPIYHHGYRPHAYYPRYVTALPRGYRLVNRGGVVYYHVNDCYYRPHYQNHGRVFVQVSF